VNARRTRLAALVVAVVLIVAGAPAAAVAAWRATATAPAFSLSTGSLAAPTTTCTSKPAVLGLSSYAQISWPAVPRASSYTVVATNTANGASGVLASGVTGTSIDVTGTLLGTLLAAVLDALLGGGNVVVTVTAVDQGWTSPPSNGHGIVLSGIVSGLLGGVKCQGT